MEITWTVSLIYIIVSLLILFLLSWRILKTLKWIWGIRPKKTDLFGDDAKTRLIGLAGAAVFFPKAITTMINIPIKFFYLFYVVLPWQLIQNLQREIYQCSAATTSCLLPITQSFIRPWIDAIYNFLGRLSPTTTDYRQIIYFFAIWALFTFLFDLPDKVDRAKKSKKNQRVFFDPTKINFLFYIILVIAVYFSATALITIPILQETVPVPENKSAKSLEESLTAIYDRWSKETSANNTPTEHFTEIEEYLAEKPDVQPSLTNNFAELKSVQQGMYDRLLGKIDIIKSQLEEEKSKAVDNYGTGIVSKKGFSETIKHYASLEEWYRDLITSQKKDIQKCKSDIVLAERTIRDFTAYSLVQLRSNKTLSDDDFQHIKTNLENVCAYSENEFETPPLRPELGSDLGPFSFIASWLLKTESMSLSQLVGMLGFGLLGAATSSLIRRSTKITKQEGALKNGQIVEDLPFFIIRGTTATLVLFLAVKGGTAIFVTNGSELNSYVLLLTCFVASVFSEVVWKWAKEWLENLLKDKDTGDANGSELQTSESTSATKPNVNIAEGSKKNDPSTEAK